MRDSCRKSNPGDKLPGKTGLQTGNRRDIHRLGVVSVIAMISKKPGTEKRGWFANPDGNRYAQPHAAAAEQDGSESGYIAPDGSYSPHPAQHLFIQRW